MPENPSIRINKVVKEFNIGISTLVAFLKKKGIAVDESPNAKISKEAYALVAKEFGREVLLKEESKRISENVKAITGEAARESRETENKIANKTEPKTSATPENQVVPDITPDPQFEPEPQVSPLREEEVQPKAEPQAIAQQEPQPEPTLSPAQEPAPITETTPPTEVKTETVPQPTPEPETVSAPDPAPAPVSPVVGHLNINTLKERSQKSGMGKKEKKKASFAAHEQQVKPAEQEQPDRQEKPILQEQPARQEKGTPQEPPVIEHIETRYEKLAGPTIQGKVDLTKFEKKRPEKSQNKDKKGKRERIQKDTGKMIDVAKEAARKEHGGGQQQESGKRNRKKERFKPIHNEVDQDEIQRQIKETYAKMNEGKGKTRTSKYNRDKREKVREKENEIREAQEAESTVLHVTEFVTVSELATLIGKPAVQVISACMNLGLMVSINQRLDAEALVLVAEEFGYTVEFETVESTKTVEVEEDRPEDLVPRPPIITVMGHVDHGKTSLLDYIRNANVIAGEAGGITQHIGAYSVKLKSGRVITFLDTPGHEAFTAMRARGAKITDLAIIIVAADDAIMPQTVEAISHATAAGVPMIFAINKIDKPGANPEKIREQLANRNILVEDWGGKYQCQEISAKKGINVDKLLEKVLLEADLLELKANPNKKAAGSVIESSLDKGRGYLATIMVQEGTLRIGDIMLSGTYSGRVKAMFNERGQKLEEAGPSTPVSVLGLNGAPTAGEIFNVMDSEKEAREVAAKREQLKRAQDNLTNPFVTLEELGRRIAKGNFKELNLIVKGDVDGSVEALSDSLIKLSTEEIQINVIHKAVGGISETDIQLATASDAIIIGFQVRPSAAARKMAEKERIEIRLYSVIYDAIEEVTSAMEGMLAPEEKEEVTATVEVRETFKISKVGTIAGCMVKEGKIVRNAKVRVIRDGIVIYTGVLGSLKRFKDDVKEVSSGYDCGLNIENYNDIKVDDIIEAYTIVEVKRTL